MVKKANEERSTGKKVASSALFKIDTSHTLKQTYLQEDPGGIKVPRVTSCVAVWTLFGTRKNLFWELGIRGAVPQVAKIKQAKGSLYGLTFAE